MTKRKTKHNKLVEKTAAWYESRGYSVSRALKGKKQPQLLGGKKADLEAKKRGDHIFIEIETPRSMKRDRKQRHILRKSAKRIGARFRVKKTNY